VLRLSVLAAVADEPGSPQLIHRVEAPALGRADRPQQPSPAPHLVLDPAHGAVARGAGLQVRAQEMTVEVAEGEGRGVVEVVAVGDALIVVFHRGYTPPSTSTLRGPVIAASRQARLQHYMTSLTRLRLRLWMRHARPASMSVPMFISSVLASSQAQSSWDLEGGHGVA